MTNLHKKIAILAVSAFIFTFTGCKKDDVYGSFTLDASSLDFEWAQTKEVGFNAQYVTRYNTPTFPDGWTCTRSGGKYIITSPSQGNSSAEMTGTVEISVETENGVTLKRKIAVAVKIATEITRTANSIIVTEQGKRFKFNALRRGHETTETITGAARATRVWATSTSTIINVSLEGKYIYFATADPDKFKEGNAVVAVTDSDGNILWSWHIWATDYDPADDPDMSGGFRVMNRNLGALTLLNSTPEEDAVRSYGLYYQWGRKDPFVGPAEWNSTTPHPLYNNNDIYTTHAYAISSDDDNDHGHAGTMGYAIAHPNTFIAGNKDNGFDWLYSGHDTGLWSSSKTVNDPCPAGWKVAPPTIWADFTTTGGATTDHAEFNVVESEDEYKYGWTFINGEETIFYPAAGRRNFSPGLASSARNFTNVVNDENGIGYPVGFYWSSTHPSPVPANALYPFEGTGSLVFRRDYINPAYVVSEVSEHAPAGGFPLRCVAE